MNLKIINAEHNIATITPDQLPKGMRKHVLILYYPAGDTIVLNDDNPVIDTLVELIEVYLSLSNMGRSEASKFAIDGLSNNIIEITMVLNRIIRTRRKLYKSMRAPYCLSC